MFKSSAIKNLIGSLLLIASQQIVQNTLTAQTPPLTIAKITNYFNLNKQNNKLFAFKSRNGIGVIVQGKKTCDLYFIDSLNHIDTVKLKNIIQIGEILDVCQTDSTLAILTFNGIFSYLVHSDFRITQNKFYSLSQDKEKFIFTSIYISNSSIFLISYLQKKQNTKNILTIYKFSLDLEQQNKFSIKYANSLSTYLYKLEWNNFSLVNGIGDNIYFCTPLGDEIIIFSLKSENFISFKTGLRLNDDSRVIKKMNSILKFDAKYKTERSQDAIFAFEDSINFIRGIVFSHQQLLLRSNSNEISDSTLCCRLYLFSINANEISNLGYSAYLDYSNSVILTPRKLSIAIGFNNWLRYSNDFIVYNLITKPADFNKMMPYPYNYEVNAIRKYLSFFYLE